MCALQETRREGFSMFSLITTMCIILVNAVDLVFLLLKIISLAVLLLLVEYQILIMTANFCYIMQLFQ